MADTFSSLEHIYCCTSVVHAQLLSLVTNSCSPRPRDVHVIMCTYPRGSTHAPLWGRLHAAQTLWLHRLYTWRATAQCKQPVSSIVCMKCSHKAVVLLFSSNFFLLLRNIQDLLSCIQSENSPVETVQGLLLVWVCCLKCRWDSEMWSSKSGWSNRLLGLKADMENCTAVCNTHTGFYNSGKLFSCDYERTHVEHFCVCETLMEPQPVSPHKLAFTGPDYTSIQDCTSCVWHFADSLS